MEPIVGSILSPDDPKRSQDYPKRTIRRFKESKNNIFKKVVFAWDIQLFFVLRASRIRINKHKKTPKRHPKNSKTTKKEPKIGPKNYKKIVQNLRQHDQKKRQAIKNQKKQHFLDPLPPHLRDPNNAPPKSKREG